MLRKITTNALTFFCGCLAFHFFAKEPTTSVRGSSSHFEDISPKIFLTPDPHRQSDIRQKSDEKSKVTRDDFMENANQARRERATSSREQWDEKRRQYSDFTLYLIDRHPREVAEEMINAFR